MSILFWRHTGESTSKEISDEHPLPTRDYGPVFGHVGYVKETLTIAATALPFTNGTHRGEAARAVCGPLESGQVRYWVDGSVPTATVGHILNVGDSLVVDTPQEIANFLAIRTGGVSGSLPVTYEKRSEL